MTEFSVIARPKAYAAIVDQLIERITEGSLAAGSRLPAERQLALSLGVSRGTLKEAIRVMEHAGVLEVRPGSGTYVTGAVDDEGALLRARAETQGEFSPLDVIVARRGLEPISAQSASVAASAKDRLAISAALEEQRRATEAGEDPTEPDLAFHLAIAVASKNAVLQTLTEQVIGFMRQPAWVRMKQAARQSEDAARGFLAEHDRIYEALESGDGVAAGAAMAEHLLSIERGLRAQTGFLA